MDENVEYFALHSALFLKRKQNAMPQEPWYSEGLAFECKNCGRCCRGPGGYVWVTMEEAEDLAKALGMAMAQFAKTMLRNTFAGLALIDTPNGDCPLLSAEGSCRVYAKRPMQCRTWPWWKENLSSQASWDRCARDCPGINSGSKHSRLYMEAEAAKDFKGF